MWMYLVQLRIAQEETTVKPVGCHFAFPGPSMVEAW
jgi:hypothetical protein